MAGAVWDGPTGEMPIVRQSEHGAFAVGVRRRSRTRQRRRTTATKRKLFVNDKDILHGKGVIVMPGGDKTGPLGAGPMTGRALGPCAGNDAPGYDSAAPGRGFFGRGRGGGGGGGQGRRRRFFAAGPMNQDQALRNQLDEMKARLDKMEASSDTREA